MAKLIININTIEKVKSFVQAVQDIPFDVLVQNDRFVVDGKSIMGIFSLNINNNLYLYPAIQGMDAEIDNKNIHILKDLLADYIIDIKE